jgi:hypothetical protein
VGPRVAGRPVRHSLAPRRGETSTGSTIVAAARSDAMRLGLPLDVALAGMAACGFGAAYNAP